jgi:hypothetical protein
MIHKLHWPSDGGAPVRQADPPSEHAPPTSTAETCNTYTIPREGGVSHAPTWH